MGVVVIKVCRGRKIERDYRYNSNQAVHPTQLRFNISVFCQTLTFDDSDYAETRDYKKRMPLLLTSLLNNSFLTCVPLPLSYLPVYRTGSSFGRCRVKNPARVQGKVNYEIRGIREFME